MLLELQAEQTAWLSKEAEVLSTDDSFKYEWDISLPATVMAVYTQDGFLTNGKQMKAGQVVGLVLDKLSYYAEAGGQEADTGTLEILDDDGTVAGRFIVTDTQVYAGFLLHQGMLEEGRENDTKLEIGAHINCQVDYDQRRLIALNHSMTHVMNAALCKVLGDSVDQRGSLCNEEKLHFDFSHKKAMTVAELQEVEKLCQEAIAAAQPLTSAVMPLEKAQVIDGVRAVVGEVYPDPALPRVFDVSRLSTKVKPAGLPGVIFSLERVGSKYPVVVCRSNRLPTQFTAKACHQMVAQYGC